MDGSSHESQFVQSKGKTNSIVERIAIGISLLLFCASICAVIFLRQTLNEGEANPPGFQNGDYLFDPLGPISTLKELEQKSELIVEARFQAISGEGITRPNGYDEDDPMSSSNNPRGPGVPYTLLTFRVDSYLKGSGPTEIIIMHPDDLIRTDGTPENPKPEVNESMLMFLHANQMYTGTWSTVRGPFGRMVESAGYVSYAHTPPGQSKPQPVPFFQGLTLAEAEEKLRSTIVQ